MLPSEPARQGYVCISVNYIIPNQLARFPLCIERVYKSKLYNPNQLTYSAHIGLAMYNLCSHVELECSGRSAVKMNGRKGVIRKQKKRW